MATSTVIHHPYPKVGEPFEFGLHSDDRHNRPLDLVRRTGHNPTGWVHDGPVFVGRAIRTHKLVELKSILTFDEVLAELARHGRTQEGQWVIGFKATFSVSDGKGPVGIADASWVAPDGYHNFPCVGRGGDPLFHRAAGTFGTVWRWIVTAPFANGSR